MGEMSASPPLICFIQLSDRLAQRGGVGHAGRMHMANPLGYTSGMDLHSLREGGVSYTKVPLASYVT